MKMHLIEKYNTLTRWHRRQGTAELFQFFTAYLFLPTQILLFAFKPIIIGVVGIGPGDVAYHPLNLTGAISLIYINLVGALVYVSLKGKNWLRSISFFLFLLAAIQIGFLYVNLFQGVFGNIEISIVNLFFTYIACALVTYLVFLSIYLRSPKKWDKKAFKLQDMSVLLIAFLAISAKLISTQNINVEKLENVWLLLASGAFAIQFAKLTFEYFKR